MTPAVTYDEYVASLSNLVGVTDPTLETTDSLAIMVGAESLGKLNPVDRTTLAEWTVSNLDHAYILGLVLGISQERMKNLLRHRFSSTSIRRQAKADAESLVDWLDNEFDIIRLLIKQFATQYSFGDVLVARATSRSRAAAAGTSGRSVEDEIEAVAKDLGLPYQRRVAARAAKSPSARSAGGLCCLRATNE
jgi:hypothetical protein